MNFICYGTYELQENSQSWNEKKKMKWATCKHENSWLLCLIFCMWPLYMYGAVVLDCTCHLILCQPEIYLLLKKRDGCFNWRVWFKRGVRVQTIFCLFLLLLQFWQSSFHVPSNAVFVCVVFFLSSKPIVNDLAIVTAISLPTNSSNWNKRAMLGLLIDFVKGKQN